MKPIKYMCTSSAFLLYLLFSTVIGFSQNGKIDSLKTELQSHLAEDTVRVNLLNSLAFKYIKHDVHLAENRAVEANELAQKISFTRGEARSLVVLSNIFMSKNDYDKAELDGLNALELFKQIDNSYGISSTYNMLGTICIHQNQVDKAESYFNRGLKVAEEMEHNKLQGICHNSLGNVAFSKGELDKAQECFKSSIEFYERMKYTPGILSTCNNIAVVYMIQGRYLEALEYFNKNLEIYRLENDKDGIAASTLNLSGVYWEIDKPEKALVYLNESLELSRELEDKRKVAKCLLDIGVIYLESEKFEQAQDHFKEALSINTAINEIQGQFFCHYHIGDLHLNNKHVDKAEIHFDLALSLAKESQSKVFICYANISLAELYHVQKKYPKAIQYGLKGKEMADSLDLVLQSKEISHTLSKTYEATRDYKSSLTYHKIFKTLSDSLFNKENIEKIANLEYEYKYKQKLYAASVREKALTRTVISTSADLEKSQMSYLLAIIGFLIVSIVFGSIIIYLKFRNIKSKTQNIVVEQKLLRSQMTPHFVFNSLSVLQGMILNKEEKKSVTYLSKFSKLLRIILENSREKTVSLSQELNAIENYLALQNLENEAYKYVIIVEENIDVTLFEIPAMLIQPFAENSVEHAFPDTIENKMIDIHISFLNNKLICTITDNGIGINFQKQILRKDKKSLATTITSERLKILSRNFKINGSVAIEDRQKFNEKGTIVTLEIPYKLHEK